MRKPTIVEIKLWLKREINENGRTVLKESPFFSRDTLRFFGQKMSDFRVEKTKKENIYKLIGKSNNFIGKNILYSEHYIEFVHYTNVYGSKCISHCRIIDNPFKGDSDV